MKTKITCSIICLSILLFIISCSKDIKPPTITTSDIKDIDNTSATVGGIIVSDGGGTITECGVFWGTINNPEKNGTKLVIGSVSGQFSYLLTGLTPNTVYYVTAYAINSQGITYGVSVSFTTNGELPTVTTNDIIVFTYSSATVSGNVTADGNVAVTENGVFWGTSQNPEATGTKLPIGNGTGVFSDNLSGLTSNTTYFVKAYATNNIGTAYGNQVSFTTSTVKIMFIENYNKFIEIPVSAGQLVEIKVSNSIYSQDVSLAYDDPMLLGIFGASDGQDGSEFVGKLFEGTNYYNSNPQTWSFVSNSNTSKIWVAAFGITQTDNLHGKFDLIVNGISYEILPANLIFVENIKEAREFTYTGSTVSAEISNSIVSIDPEGDSKEDPFLLVMFGGSNEQDGSATVGAIFQGTNYYNSVPQDWSYTSNTDTKKLWAIPIGVTPTTNLSRKFELKLNNVHYDILP
jgi:hypothetical protein